MRGRTTLVIAHRLSTIERADRIVVDARRRDRRDRARTPSCSRAAVTTRRCTGCSSPSELAVPSGQPRLLESTSGTATARCAGDCGRSRPSIVALARLRRTAYRRGWRRDRRSAGPGDRRRQRQRRRHRQDAIRHLARRPAEAARPQGRHRHARLSRQGHRVAARRRGRERSARGRRRARAARAPHGLPRRRGPDRVACVEALLAERARRRRAVRRRPAALPARRARSRSPSSTARAAWATAYACRRAAARAACRACRKSMRSS